MRVLVAVPDAVPAVIAEFACFTVAIPVVLSSVTDIPFAPTTLLASIVPPDVTVMLSSFDLSAALIQPAAEVVALSAISAIVQLTLPDQSTDLPVLPIVNVRASRLPCKVVA